MKKTRFLALLLVALMVCSCALAETADDPVVIKVGDVVVRLSVMQAYFDELYQYYADEYGAYDFELSADDILYIRDEALSLMLEEVNMQIMTEIMDAKIDDYGLGTITDEDKETVRAQSDKEFDEGIALYAESLNISIEEAEENLVAYDITRESQYESMLASLPYQRLYDKVIEGVTVSDDAVQQEYDSYVAADKETYEDDVPTFELHTQYYGSEVFYIPTGYRLVKYILLDFPEEIIAQMTALEADAEALQAEIDALKDELYAQENVQDDEENPPRDPEEINVEISDKEKALDALVEEYDALRAQAIPALQDTLDEIYAKIDAGESFDDLIAAYGSTTDTGANEDGLYQVHKDSVFCDYDFRNAAVALAKINDVSEPVISVWGVHIIQYAGDVNGGPVEMSEEVAESIRESLLQSQEDAIIEETVLQWQVEYGDLTTEVYPELIVLPETNDTDDEASAPDATQTPSD